jgi:pimeloyl-ACP methyl ester carboxylesterase
MEPQIRYTTTEDGASIAYATMGAGPVVIMTSPMHSFSARLRLSPGQRLLSERIAEQFTLVLYDGRGMGLSSREHRDYGLEARIRDLEAVIRAVDAQTFALYGFIYGAFVAVVYAARNPDRATKLVLANATPSGNR